MVKTRLIILMAGLLCLSACAPKHQWGLIPVNGRLTAVVASNADNIDETMGTVDSLGVYTAPNGKVFTDCSASKVASLMIGSQDVMRNLKTCIGHSKEAMTKGIPESVLGNWAADVLKSEAEKIFLKRIDLLVINLGGIRTDMPAGDILLDDIYSMFPFNNYLCYVEIPGSEIRKAFDFMAETYVQPVSGARIVIKDHKLQNVEIAGAPLDDNRYYRVATADFLLDGGDKFYFARNARRCVVSEYKLKDCIRDYVTGQEAQGKLIEGKLDGRAVTIE